MSGDIIYATELYTMPGDIFCASCGQLAYMERLKSGWHKQKNPAAVGYCCNHKCGMNEVRFIYPLPLPLPYVLEKAPVSTAIVPSVEVVSV